MQHHHTLCQLLAPLLFPLLIPAHCSPDMVVVLLLLLLCICVQVRLRNAAQGFTSQLLTAPCIRTLVGDGVDLLAWEFATNDEYPAVIEAGTAERVRLAEVWMRAAVRLRPKALVFVHFWDRDLEFWEIGKAYPPDKAWVPTNYVADHVLRGQGIDGLSVNMVGMLTSGLMDTAGKKTSFLRDTHHPNDLAFNITADALRLGLLQLWRLGLLTTGADAGGAAADPAAPVAQQPQPLLQPGLLVPVLDQWPVCYLTAQPQFGTAQPELTELGCQAGSNGAGCMLVPYGKAAANRADRKSMMQLPDCAAGDTTSGIVFGVNTTQPLTYLWLSCGAGSDCKGLRVYLDDSVVRSNVDTRPDKFISYFYLWVRNITGTPLQSAKTVRLCRDASGATGDVKVERVLLWVRDGSASMP